jgi:dTDP-4-dehydrorhamnose reductase
MFGHVAAQILARRWIVLTTARRPGEERVTFDVLQPDSDLATLLGRLRPSGLIINAAAVLASDIANSVSAQARERALAINAVFPHRLARIAGDLGLRVIQISTDAVFGRTAGVVNEANVIGPDDFYGVSKAAGELSDACCLTIRCSLVGPPAPGRSRGLWAWLVDEPHRTTLRGYVNHLWSGITTVQLAEVCSALTDPECFSATRDQGAIHHLAPNAVVSKYDLVRALVRVLRADLAVEPALAENYACRVLVSRHAALDRFVPRYSDWPAAIAAAAERCAPTT